VITSLQLLKLGQELMEQVRPKLGPKIRLTDAVQYRDGLMIAVTAFVPLRRKNLATLDTLRHVRLAHDPCTIVIPKEETKTGSPIEFEIPPFLLPWPCTHKIACPLYAQ